MNPQYINAVATNRLPQPTPLEAYKKKSIANKNRLLDPKCQQSHWQIFLMEDISEYIAEISQSGSTILTMIDLTAGFWQLLLHPRAREYTAFTIPGQGQYQ